MLGALLILALGQMYLLSPGGRPISYSEFKSLVRSGQVAEVVVAETTIRGELKKADGPTTFTTTRIEDPNGQVIELDLSKLPEGTPKIAGTEVKWWDDTEAYKKTKPFFPELAALFAHQIHKGPGTPARIAEILRLA